MPSISSAQVSVLVTATAVAAADATRETITIKNTDATNPIYLGKDNTVTISTGHKLSAGGILTLTDAAQSAIWGIATGGTVVVTTLAEIY